MPLTPHHIKNLETRWKQLLPTQEMKTPSILINGDNVLYIDRSQSTYTGQEVVEFGLYTQNTIKKGEMVCFYKTENNIIPLLSKQAQEYYYNRVNDANGRKLYFTELRRFSKYAPEVRLRLHQWLLKINRKDVWETIVSRWIDDVYDTSGLPLTENEKFFGRCVASYANDPFDLEETISHLKETIPKKEIHLYYTSVYNCQFKADDFQFYLNSTRKINEGNEILLDYGVPYWINFLLENKQAEWYNIFKEAISEGVTIVRRFVDNDPLDLIPDEQEFVDVFAPFQKQWEIGIFKYNVNDSYGVYEKMSNISIEKYEEATGRKPKVKKRTKISNFVPKRKISDRVSYFGPKRKSYAESSYEESSDEDNSDDSD
jgi:hypothetical protein